MMDKMYIEIPSGRVFLNDYRVFSIRRKPYIMVDAEKVFLTDVQKTLARGMVKAFSPMIDYLNGTLEESLYE